MNIKGFLSLEKVFYQMSIGGHATGCPLLTEIPTFENLITIGSGLRIRQTGLTNITGFNNVQVIGDLDPSWGNLYIDENDNLLEITGFAKLNKLEGDLGVGQNNKLQSLHGFINLTEVRALLIGGNTSLESLSGLENIDMLSAGAGGTSIGISRNPMLTDCSILCKLFSNGTVKGLVLIFDNPSKCSSEIEVKEECIPDFDKDGILDDDDLDDDNDGILDTVEQNGDPNRDTDFDNYPDHKDLDSDNDGCFDVIEASFTDNDTNGSLGNLPDTVDSNGLIIGELDGYTTPLDNNSDSVFDFQQTNTLSAGENGNLEICINSTSVDLFDNLTGTPDTGGVWTPSLTSGTGLFDPSIDTAGVYTYTVTNGVCGSDTSEINVTIDVLPNAGEDGNLEICINSTSVDLFDNLTGMPDTGGVWTPSLTSGTGMFDPSMDTAGIYTYTITNGVCGSDTSEVNVTITNVTPISDYEIKIKEFSSNNSLEVIINSNLEYEFSLDGINYQGSNVFNNLTGGDYIVYVQEVNGCGILETIASILDYPKFFTPNNDGFNDFWKLKGKTDKNYSIYIYDRYGKLLKHLPNSESSWDGTYNGKQLQTNGYWFKVVFIDGIVKNGHFTLKR
jgi:gliding motility-associated-like protein